MRPAFAVLSLGFVMLGVQLPAQELGAIIAPASGGVEIDEIVIVRRAARGAVKTADLTKMTVNLQLTANWEKREPQSFDHLVRLHSLSPIEDDTGKTLTTEKRLKRIDYLEGEVRGRSWVPETDERGGPSISLLLDAPARSATKIKALQGRAEVSRAKTIHIQFDNLSAIHGKELEHPDLPTLKDLKLRFSIKANDGQVVAKLSAPFNYASPWFRGRLNEWSLMRGEGEPQLSSAHITPRDGGVTVERRYRQPDFAGWSLHLVVLEPLETKTFDFEFRDVELP